MPRRVLVGTERLGYSDTANFRLAFRRWTCVSPRAYVARAVADLPVTVMRTHRDESSYAGVLQ
jgi:AraC-like DNA-binding protein